MTEKRTAADILAAIESKVDGINERHEAFQQSVNERLDAVDESLAKPKVVSGDLDTGLLDEADKFSWHRAIRAQAAGDWSNAGFEREVMAAAGSSFEKIDERALASGSGAGSHLVPAEVTSKLIPLIREKLVQTRLGVTELNLRGRGNSIKMPKQTSTTTGYWLGENAEITESTAGTDELEITPKKGAILTKYSGNLIREGTVVGIENFVRNDIAARMATLLNTALLHGTGSSNQPEGVFTNSSTSTVAISSNVDATILEKLLLMVEELDVQVGALGIAGSAQWLMHPRAKHRIGSILHSGGGPILTGEYGGDWRLGMGTRLLGYNIVDSGLISTTDKTTSLPDTTDIMIGFWSEVIAASWGTMELMSSNVAGNAFAYDQIWARIISEVDYQIMHPATLVKGTALNLNVAS